MKKYSILIAMVVIVALMSSADIYANCSRCGKAGHNKATCPSGSKLGTALEFGSELAWAEGLVKDKNKETNKWGYINKAGKAVIAYKYEDAVSFSNGLAEVKLNGKWGIINKKGKEVIPIKYEEIVNGGLVAVKLNGKWGFLTKKGKEIVSPKYEDISKFAVFSGGEGTAKVKLNGDWIYIDNKGNQVEKPGFLKRITGKK
jgi:hypothetical protein